MQLRFDNLFNGQKSLEDVANNVINQNLNQLEQDFNPQIEASMSKRTLAVFNTFFEKASFDELFP